MNWIKLRVIDVNDNEFLKLKGKTFDCLLAKSEDVIKLIRSAFVISLCHDKCISDEKLQVCEQFIYECASKIVLIPNVDVDFKMKFSLIRNKLAHGEYPKYDKKLVFADDKKEMDLVIEYIALFRNKKAENNIGSDFEVITDIDNELILRMLKLTDKIVESSELSGTVEVTLDKYKVTICYDDSASKGEEKAALEKEKDSLENSIQRREKLLSNENYVAKAPEKIVNQERESLETEKEKLKVVIDRLEQLK